MAKKSKGVSGKRQVKRVDERPAATPMPAPQKPAATEKVPERVREKDAGFGVIKVAAGVLIVLVLGSGVAVKLLGQEAQMRGDKLPGESCLKTEECSSGSRCLAWQDGPKRCFEMCGGDHECPPGSTCSSAAQQTGRRKTRVRAVCVPDDEL